MVFSYNTTILSSFCPSSHKGSHFIKERALISGRLANVHVRLLFNQRHSRCWSFLLSSNRLVVHPRR